MAIHKMSSKELNDLIKDTQNTVKGMTKSIDELKEDLQRKMEILSNQTEYTGLVSRRIEDKVEAFPEGDTVKGIQNRTVFAAEHDLKGVYDQFGSTVHAAFSKAPVNILNAFTGSDWIYRPTAEVVINGESKSRNRNMLVHDQAKEKGFAFEEYDSPELKLEVIVDRGLIMGPMEFNVLEISPFLAGSFSIESMKVYDIYPEEESAPDFTMENMESIGPSRIILDKKYALSRLELNIRLNFRNEQGKYPFGLKHLYFLNADFRSDSFALIRKEFSGFIHSIGETVFLKDLTGRHASTASEEKVKFYLDLVAGVPEYEIQTSTYQGEWPLTRNTRHFYVRVPLNGKSLQSVEIKDVILR